MDRQAHFNSLMQRIDQRKQAMSSYYANRAKSRGLLDQAGQGPLSGMDTGSGIGHMPPPRLYGGTPLASHVGGMLGVALTAGGPASAGPPGVAPYQLQRGRKIYSGPRDIKPNMLQDSYYESLRRGIDRLAAPIVPNYSPLAKQPPAQGPSPTSPFGIGQPQGASAAPNQPQIGLPGSPPPQSLPAPGLGMLPQGPFPQAGALGQGGLHSGATFPDPNYVDDITPQDAERAYGFQQGRQRLLDRQAEGQSRWQRFFQDQDEQNRQTGLANLSPQHFGGDYGANPLGSSSQRTQDRSARAILGDAPDAPDPRFASMDRFLKPQTVDINPFKDNVRTQSWKDMESRNGYGLNRGPGDNSEHVRPMNMQPLVSEKEAANAQNGTVIGQYGNSDLVRINGKNVLIGRKSPNYSEVVQGTKSPRQASDEGRSRTANEYLMADAAAAGIDTSKPEWKSQILGINRANHQSQMQQNQNRRGLQRMYDDGHRRQMSGNDIRSMYGVSSEPPPRNTGLGVSGGPALPVDKAVAGLQQHDPSPWAIVGVPDLTKATPGSLIKALEGKSYQRMSPETKKKMQMDIENWFHALEEPTEADEEVLATARGDKKALERIKASRDKRRQEWNSHVWSIPGQF